MQIDVNVDLAETDLNTPIEHRFVRQLNEDGDWLQEPATLGDLIVEKAVQDFAQDREAWESLKTRIKRITDEEIRLRVEPLIEQALTDPIQQTNEFGDPRGKPILLRDLIIKDAQDKLAKVQSRGSAYDRQQSIVEKLVSDAVDRELTRELQETIAEEKAKIVAAMRAKGAEILAETIKGGVLR